MPNVPHSCGQVPLTARARADRPGAPQEEAFRAKETFNGDEKWTTGEPQRCH